MAGLPGRQLIRGLRSEYHTLSHWKFTYGCRKTPQHHVISGGNGNIAVSALIAAPKSERPDLVRSSNQKGQEAKRQHTMVQRSAEVLPEGRAGAGIVGGKEQRQHIQQAKCASGTHQNAKDQRHADGQFPVRHKEGHRRRVWQHEGSKHWNHKRVSTIAQKYLNPKLKSAMERESPPKNYAFAKYQA